MSKHMEIIQKLLNLADSNPNEAEAMAAAEKAAMLALKYGISLDDIKKAKGQKDVNQSIVYTTAKRQRWVSYIVSGVCLINGCHFYVNNLPNIVEYTVVGDDNARTVVKLTVDYLIETVLRLNREEVKRQGLTQKQRGAFRKAFRYGAGVRLNERFSELYNDLTKDDTKAKEKTGSTALVVSNYYETKVEEANTWLVEQGITLTTKKARSIKLDNGAYEKGRKAGGSISLNKQIS